MELTVKERLVLMATLPKEGSFTILKLLRKLKEDLSFDDSENKKLRFVQEGDMVRWDETQNIVKDIKTGETMMNLIVNALKELDRKGKLTEDHFTLYEKFVEVDFR